MQVRKLWAAASAITALLAAGLVLAPPAAAVHSATSVTPSSLPQGATGATIVIAGSLFSDALGPVGVSVSGTPGEVTVDSVTLDSSSQITAHVTILDNAATTARDVIVSQGIGGLDTATCAGCLTVAARPTISSLTTSAGTNTGPGNTTIGANGANFVSGATLKLVRDGFSDIVVPSPVVTGGTTISGSVSLVGQAPGRWAVVVTNPDGGTDQFGDGVDTGYLITGQAPTVTSSNPASRGAGSTAQTLTLTGTNLARGATVAFSGTGITPTGYSWVSLTSYQVTVDVDGAAAVGARDITLTNTDGQDATCTGCFTVNAGPTVTDVAPSSRGQGATNQVLTIAGTGFVATPAVAFSGTGITVTDVVRDSAAQLTVTVSIAAGAATGTRDLTVTNPDGGAATLVGDFTVNPAPTVSSATPASRGQSATNQDIVVAGTGFVATPTVEVSGSGVTVNGVTFDSATQLTVNVTVASDASLGARDITVVNPDGGTAVGSGVFTVTVAPAITSLSPNALGQGVSQHTVVVTGTGFVATPTVSVSGADVTVDDVTHDSATKLTIHVTVGATAATGARDVTVTNPDAGTSTSVGALTIDAAPTVTSATPSSLGRGATANVVIAGTGFAATPAVEFSGNGITVNTITRDSATQLTVNVTIASGADLTARDIVVTNTDGGTDTCTGCFTVVSGPSITSITPNAGGNAGSVSITNLAGSGFANNAVVQLERSGQAPIVMTGTTVTNGGTKITGSFDLSGGGGAPAAPGPWTVRVTNPTDGGSASLVDGFTVAGATPTLTAVEPNVIGRGGSRPVVLTGSGFAAGAIVTVSGTGVTVSSTTVVSATEIDATFAAASDATTGARDVVVTNTDGSTVTCTGCLTVNAAPTVTNVAPSSRGQGTTDQILTVTGTGFVATPTVVFSGSGVAVSNVVRDSASQLTVTVSVAGDATTGARDITVTNPDKGVGTLAAAFTVNAKPTVTNVAPSSRGQGATNQVLTVTGTGFLATPTVVFSGSGVSVSNVVRDSATQLSVTVSVAANATTGARDITVTNPDAGVGSLVSAFTVNAKPTITSVFPSFGARDTEDEIVITGSGFVATPTVTFSSTGITVSNVVRNSATQLTVTVSIAADAPTTTRDVTVTNPDGGTATKLAAFTVKAVLPTHDFSGDGCSDLLAVSFDGTMRDYTGNCAGGFSGAPASVPGDWRVASEVFRSDMNADGCDDVLLTTSDGRLFVFFGNCAGGFGPVSLIGSGWNDVARILSPGDWTGDGCADILGVLPNGDLLRYSGNCAGGFISGAGVRIGSGWNDIARILAPGDWSGDGCVDLLGVLPTGDLLRYSGDCTGGFLNGAGAKIGTSWAGFRFVR